MNVVLSCVVICASEQVLYQGLVSLLPRLNTKIKRLDQKGKTAFCLLYPKTVRLLLMLRSNARLMCIPMPLVLVSRPLETTLIRSFNNSPSVSNPSRSEALLRSGIL